MEWSTIIPLAILGGLALAGIIIAIMVMMGKKSNVEYIILQTFEGSQRPLMKKGLVDVKNDGTRMAEHVIGEGSNKIYVGTFHQKYLKPTTHGKYLMMLEEFDVGRYRPLEYNGDIKKSKIKIPVYTDIPKKDKEGNTLQDVYGNVLYEFKNDEKGRPLYREIEEDISSMVSVPNDDIDYMLSRKEKNKKLLERKEKESKWLPYLLGGAAFVFVFLGVVLSSYYNFQSASEIKEGLGNFNAAAQTEQIINTFVDRMTNKTTRDLFKESGDGVNIDTPPGK